MPTPQQSTTYDPSPTRHQSIQMKACISLANVSNRTMPDEELKKEELKCLEAARWYQIWPYVVASCWADEDLFENIINDGKTYHNAALRNLLADYGLPAKTLYSNFPNLAFRKSAATYCPQQRQNGWLSSLCLLGGSAVIPIPECPSGVDCSLALANYLMYGTYLPFAPNFGVTEILAPEAHVRVQNTRLHSQMSQTETCGPAGDEGAPLDVPGDESASDALDCDEAWRVTFGRILARCWEDPEAMKLLTDEQLTDSEKAQYRDYLFRLFDYEAPIGLSISFRRVANPGFWSDKTNKTYTWKLDELRSTLTLNIPGKPQEEAPMALADYCATGKAQLFTT